MSEPPQPPQPPSGDVRQHPRVAVDAFVRVFDSRRQDGRAGDQREFVLRTRDLSEGGLFLFTRAWRLYPFELGTPLDIVLYDFDQTVSLRAVVARIVEESSPEAASFPVGFGIRIVEIDSVNRARLQSLIGRLTRGEPVY